MDLESRRRWEDYTRAKEIMLARTHIPEAPWWVVQAIDKKKARLNCIHHLLSQMSYREVEREPIVLPERQRHDATCAAQCRRRFSFRRSIERSCWASLAAD